VFLDPEDIQRMERLYGVPAEDCVSFEMGEREWSLLKRSRTKGRSHDVTLYVRRGEDLAVIAKHGYPRGVYRAPSGGVHPGETMEQGIAREVMEEMGVEVRLERYVLRMKVDFSHLGEKIGWTTHVFTAHPLATELVPRDRREIREAKWVPLAKLAGPISKAMESSGSAGLRYRGRLHRRVMEILSERA
jgi:8-oxo-dGTP pyrophosphatase MutT (NUDIX family)